MTGNREQRHERCAACGKLTPRHRLIAASAIRPHLREIIARDVPGWSNDSKICSEDLARFRRVYLEELIRAEKGQLSALDRQVIEALAREQTLAGTIDQAQEEPTFGAKIADRVAAFGGSWTFIVSFFGVLVAWMAINAIALRQEAFDPYPFILLNLVLSCLAAIQAPIIMMSQNRQEARDRQRSENDYRVNLKAELEIRHLHEKIDFLLNQQWERLIEIQRLQIDLMEERLPRGPKASKRPS
jgi:uncharacterized membrane protein